MTMYTGSTEKQLFNINGSCSCNCEGAHVLFIVCLEVENLKNVTTSFARQALKSLPLSQIWKIAAKHFFQLFYMVNLNELPLQHVKVPSNSNNLDQLHGQILERKPECQKCRLSMKMVLRDET